MWCTPCIKGKQHINKFPKKGTYKSTQNYRLIHFHICGHLQTNTHGGCKYFITFNDDKSRFCFFNLIKKSKKLNIFFIYMNFVEKQTNQKIRILRFGEGGEYK
jgi:hypothetical protein